MAENYIAILAEGIGGAVIINAFLDNNKLIYN
ncbi:hypothetical protein R078138_00675 [Convivina praedatoris]|uniref:Uncharacterized protein n=1 Tax=Convivina praedatoris TaxID=2880963 RepID=A0ABM9D1T0_9LACO|nr:hypothetical protein R077815_00555 [Convivina sp. LMG 32447]CAH1853560.1 hypothetical protein R078138_00675 [Convivina sp. LMG 32447]CAH1854504.1 hypothetical protein LMG032447_00887 [Convivina sp. LMG 32447]